MHAHCRASSTSSRTLYPRRCPQDSVVIARSPCKTADQYLRVSSMTRFASIRSRICFHTGRGSSKPLLTLAYAVPPMRATACSFAGSIVAPSGVNTPSLTCTRCIKPRTSVVVGGTEDTPSALLRRRTADGSLTSHSKFIRLSATKGGLIPVYFALQCHETADSDGTDDSR